MSELFRDQRILVVSPQPWNHIHLSKHHYALELARRDNEIVFLEPATKQSRLTEVPEASNVKVMQYEPAAPLWFRYHAKPVFRFFQQRQVQTILKAIGKVDVVWCFDFNAFLDLREFDAGLRIFHPVDPVSAESAAIAATADVVFSVSEKILSAFESVPVRRFVIDHGLSRPFEQVARRGATQLKRRPGPPRVGYAGNLARPPLDRDILKKMIVQNGDAEFHFWGPHAPMADASPQFRRTIEQFIDFLDGAPNVSLHGRVPPDQLAESLQDMDCFVLTYARHLTESDRSNSHKILEYLSTGKVVVSSRIERYLNRPELIRMSPGDDDSVLPDLLSDTLARLSELNAPELEQARRTFALDNTYEKQVDRIKEIILALPKFSS